MIKVANNLKNLITKQTKFANDADVIANMDKVFKQLSPTGDLSPEQLDPGHNSGLANYPKGMPIDPAAAAMGARTPAQAAYMDPANVKKRMAQREKDHPQLARLRNSAPHPGVFGFSWMQPERLLQFENERGAANAKAKSLVPR